MLERVCGEVDRVGYAEYEHYFGDEHLTEEDVFVFAPRAKPVALNLTRPSVLAVSQVGRAVLAGSEKLDEARRGSRSRLSGR